MLPSFKELSPVRKGFVLLILAGGMIAAWRAASRLWPPRQEMLSPEAYQEAFRESEQIDRQNWDKMWRSAGRKAPPPPATGPDHQ